MSYRQPAGWYNEFEIYLKQFLYKPKNKKSYLVGDFNLNLLDHRTNTKVKYYLNLTLQNFSIPLINKPTRVTKASTTLIDHILTNDFLETASSMGIVKSDISDHFPIFLLTNAQYLDNIQNKTTIRKQEINEKSQQYFMEYLNEVNRKHLYSLTDTNLAYENFLCTSSCLYNHAFPIKEVSLKLKNVFNPWMTKGLHKSSKKKQKLYDKFLKSKTNENGKKYKTYKSLFEILNEKSKKSYYSRKLDKWKQNIKKCGTQ